MVPSAATPSQSPLSSSVPVIENGRLKLSWKDGKTDGRPDTDKAIIWFKSDKSSFSLNGKYRLAVEYDIEAENSNPVEMLINTGNGASGVLHRFVSSSIQLGGNSFRAHNGYNYSGNLAEKITIPKKVRVTVVFDNKGSCDKFDLYINGIKIIDDFTRRQYTPTIGMLCFGISAENTVYIDNIKVYNVGMSNKEKVDSDYEFLVSGGFGAINTSRPELVENDFFCELPEGSSIRFSSDVPGLINTDGTINTPKCKTEAVVTATACIGTYKKSVSYPCTIAGELVIHPKDNDLSGWKADGYYSYYNAYTLTDGTVPAVVVTSAYDEESGELIKTSVTDNLITKKTNSSYEDNIIYGYLDISETNARVESFIIENCKSSDINIDGNLVIKNLDEEKSFWNGEDYTAVFPAFSLGDEEKISMIFAIYESGKLMDFRVKDVTVYPEGVKDSCVSGTVNIPGRTENTVVKAMLWRDFISMKPLMGVKFSLPQLPEAEKIISESLAENKLNKDDKYTYTTGAKDGSIIGIKFKVTSDGDYKINIGGKDTVFELSKISKEITVNDITVKRDVKNETEYTILLDVITKKYSLWLGNEKTVEMSELSAEIPVPEKVLFEQITGEGSISDFSVFYPTIPDADAIVLDYEYLKSDVFTHQKQSAVTTNLRLPLKGRAGSDIVWTSSDTNVIAADGVVNSENNTSVILTAKLRCGEEYLSKTFDLNVIKWEKQELPEKKKIILEDSFTDNKAVSLWQNDDSGGEIFVENEAMTVKRLDGSAKDTTTIFYMDKDLTVYNGKLYALEFTMKRTGNPLVVIRQKGPNDYCAMDWLTDGSIRYVDGYTQKFCITKEKFSQTEIKVTIFYDTLNSTFSIYIDDKPAVENVMSRSSGHGVGSVNIAMGSGQTGVLEIDNISFYETYFFSEKRVEIDYDWLTENRLVSNTDEAYKYGTVSENLNLPVLGENGSEISWTSSNEKLISSKGIVNFSEIGELVTLTATISKGKYSLTKEFTFKPFKPLSSASDALQADADTLDYENIALYDNGSKEIKRSLNLWDSAIYGSRVEWSSSNTDYITNSGRVIRPRWYEEDVPVTLTATLVNSGKTLTKTFDFTVLKDEEWEDPQYMSDEEFFGVWNGSSWENQPKMNYEYPGLSEVGEAVKANNIPLAKEKLLNYYKNRKSLPKMTSQNKLWADALTDDFQHLQQGHMFQGEFFAKNYWSMCESTLRTDNINPGAISCFGIRSWYNEASYLEVKRHNDSDISVHPRIELVVNGENRTYYAIDSYMIRAGKYRDANFNNEDVLKVQTFGDFLGDDTSHSILKFDFSDIKSTDTVTSAKLKVYAKAYPEYSGEKRMIVLVENTLSQTSDTITWNSTDGEVYSYNGLPERNDWIDPPLGSDKQYWHQNCRFYGYADAIMPEYLATGNDIYMYKMLCIINDYIKDTGNYRLSTNTVVSKPDPDGIRGGFPNSLGCLSKNNNWTKMTDVMAKYEYMTPELFTAILKNVWDSATFLVTYPTVTGNWRQYEFNSLLNTSIRMPEYYDALAGTNWRKLGQDEMESLVFQNNMSDGSYIEATAMYAYDMFNTSANHTSVAGITLTEAFMERLHRAAYYNCLLFGPDGSFMQYGDGAGADRSPTNFVKVANMREDKELEYIATYGESGEEPKWTSVHWPLSMTTVMRSDWTKQSPYLFTNVRGGGQHAHSDYNGLIVYAYGRTLLNDAGSFSYGVNDERIWGTSTIGHNSVVINDTTQERGGLTVGWNPTGTIYDWTANSSFDYLSQSTPQTKGFEHRRSVTFIKPTMWIVSDLMIPNTASGSNNYKQVWHMKPDSGLSIDTENNTVRSNYPSGANILIANADEDVSLTKKTGWYDMGYQQITDAPYAYFEKNGKGNVTIDTVLMPTNDDVNATVTAKKLETNENATALKIDFTLKGEKNTGYYYMSYNKEPGVFGKYATDGQVAFVQENASGNVLYFMIKDGTYIRNEDTGEYLVKSAVKLEEFAVDMPGTELVITTCKENDVLTANPDDNVPGVFAKKGKTDDISSAEIRLDANKTVSNVKVNGKNVKYQLTNNILKILNNT